MTDANSSVITVKAGIRKEIAIPTTSGIHTNVADHRAHTDFAIPVKTGFHFVLWTPAFAGATMT